MEPGHCCCPSIWRTPFNGPLSKLWPRRTSRLTLLYRVWGSSDRAGDRTASPGHAWIQSRYGWRILCGSQDYIEDIPLDNILAIYDENARAG